MLAGRYAVSAGVRPAAAETARDWSFGHGYFFPGLLSEPVPLQMSSRPKNETKIAMAMIRAIAFYTKKCVNLAGFSVSAAIACANVLAEALIYFSAEKGWREDLVADACDDGSIAVAVVADIVPSRIIILECDSPEGWGGLLDRFAREAG